MKEFSNRFNFRVGAGLVCMLLLAAGCTSKSPAPIKQSSPTVPSRGVTAAQTGTAGTHVVRPGETLMGIGRIYGQSVSDLIAWNGLSNPHQISVGQRLRVAPTWSGDVAVAKPVQITPIGPSSGSAAAVTPIKQQPRGGTQPYSDQAWTAVQPPATTAAPSAATAAAATPPASSAGWLWPASGTVLARFNEATNKGIDIAGNPGDPVIASGAGKVAYAGTGLRGYGKLVIINHSSEYITAYAHNQKLLVKEGDNVAKGQKIAEIGSTDADRPKLHFEIRRKGRPVNPELYLPKNR